MSYMNLPKEIKNTKNFHLWINESKDGKNLKIPYVYDNLLDNIVEYSAKNKQTVSFERALELISKYKFKDVQLGMQLNKVFTVIDLDHCLDDNDELNSFYQHMTPWIEKFATFVEKSQSGKGLHIFLNCEPKGFKCKSKEFFNNELGVGEIEIYNKGRFIALTGNVWKNYSTLNNDCKKTLDDFYDYIFPIKEKKVRELTKEEIKENILNKSNATKLVVSLIDLHLSYGGTIISETDKHYKCPCPFHNEKTVGGSFSISKENLGFKCFSCDAKGGSLKYVQLKENCTEEQAKLILKTKNIKRVEATEITEKNKKTEKELKEIQNSYNIFYSSLSDIDEEKYMIGRGFTQDDLKKYGVKFLNHSINTSKLKHKINSEEKRKLTQAGFLTSQDYFIFSAPSVIFPVFNDEKEPIYFTSRSCTSAFKMKLRGVKQEFYGTVTSDSKPIFIFEGVIDALSFKKLTGIEENVIAVYGKTSFKKCKEMYPLNTIVICVDADDDQDDYDVAVELGDYFIHPSLICEQYHIERCKDWNDILCSSFNGFVKGDYIDICQRKIETKTQKRYEKVGKLNIFNKEIEMNVLSENEMNDIEDNCIDIIDECDSENVGNKNIIFWKTTMSEDRKGNIKEGPIEFDARLLGEYLNSKGIWKDSSDENCETFIFIDNKIVHTIKNYKITINDKFKEFFKKDFPLEYKNGFYDKIVSKSKFIDRVIQSLDSIDVKSKIVRCTENITYFFFNNCFVEVSKKDGVVCKSYSELDGLIRKEHIVCRNFNNDTETHESSKFLDFLMLTQGAKYNEKGRLTLSNSSKSRFSKLRKTIGYLLHDYVEGLAKVIYLTDEKTPDFRNQKNGGTGKSLIGLAIQQLRKKHFVPGKNIDFRNTFMFSDLSLEAQIIDFDDVRDDFKIESIYNISQAPITFERKYENKKTTEKTLKYMFSSNYLVELGDASDERRVLPIFIGDFFNNANKVDTFFGTNFYSNQWNDNQWNDFFNVMINCSLMYMCCDKKEFSNWSAYEKEIYNRKSWDNLKTPIKKYFQELLIDKFENKKDKASVIMLDAQTCITKFKEISDTKKIEHGEDSLITKLILVCNQFGYKYDFKSKIGTYFIFKDKESKIKYEQDLENENMNPTIEINKENIVDFTKDNFTHYSSIIDDFNS